MSKTIVCNGRCYLHTEYMAHDLGPAEIVAYKTKWSTVCYLPLSFIQLHFSHPTIHTLPHRHAQLQIKS